MTNQENNQNSNDQQSENTGDSSKVQIQPSEPETDSAVQSEENAPGRTPGKAEGSSEIVEADLADRKD